MSHKHHRNVRWTTRTVYFYSAQKQLRFAALWSSFAPPFSPVRDTVKFFSLVVRAVMYFRPLQVFGSLALLLMISSAAAGIISQLLGRHLPDVIITTMFSTGIILFALGLLGDLINVRRR